MFSVKVAATPELISGHEHAAADGGQLQHENSVAVVVEADKHKQRSGH
ncbi:MAG: hypothetical protein GX373_07655 [Gammaproteobacteria bacterium]|nr:hypothetical protein [Gammaproteobacteria bacterium]